MLSRVADTLYWMSRYLERSENISRFIDVNWHLSLDQPSDGSQEWSALISATGDGALYLKAHQNFSKENVISFLIFDTDYPNSIISCLRAARENARTVRDIISTDMWEQINSFYHFVEKTGKYQLSVYENPNAFCEQVRLRLMTIGGITSETMLHGDAWHFIRLGRYLERADKTSRILDVKYFTLLPNLAYVGTAYDDVQWAALLRATGGLESYRQRCGRIQPNRVAEFLVFDRQFARSILRCLNAAQASLHEITGTPQGTYQNVAEQRLGALCAELGFMDIEHVFGMGLHEFTDQLQLKINRVNDTIALTFFGYVFEGNGGDS
ncbi:alpha-E domain-containing protein [Desulfococcus sp.]|uniref:alpha-E domain-containing protein n=1 Tax=Desulfococcus sp. TaxID=2025834 RepID=UPI003593BAF8